MKLKRENLEKTVNGSITLYKYNCNKTDFFLEVNKSSGMPAMRVFKGDANDPQELFETNDTLKAWNQFEVLLEVCSEKQGSSGGFKNKPQENPNILPLLAIKETASGWDVTIFALADKLQVAIGTFVVEKKNFPKPTPATVFTVNWSEQTEIMQLLQCEIIMKKYDLIFEDDPQAEVFLFIPKNIVEQGGEQGDPNPEENNKDNQKRNKKKKSKEKRKREDDEQEIDDEDEDFEDEDSEDDDEGDEDEDDKNEKLKKKIKRMLNKQDEDEKPKREKKRKSDEDDEDEDLEDDDEDFEDDDEGDEDEDDDKRKKKKKGKKKPKSDEDDEGEDDEDEDYEDDDDDFEDDDEGDDEDDDKRKKKKKRKKRKSDEDDEDEDDEDEDDDEDDEGDDDDDDDEKDRKDKKKDDSGKVKPFAKSINFSDAVNQLSQATGVQPSLVVNSFRTPSMGAAFLGANNFTKIKQDLNLPSNMTPQEFSQIIINSK